MAAGKRSLGELISKYFQGRLKKYYKIGSQSISNRGYMVQAKNGQNRCDIHLGLEVDVILKKDQRSNKRTRGIVEEILTNSSYHPHGIKVRLKSGQVGRVQEIIQ